MIIIQKLGVIYSSTKAERPWTCGSSHVSSLTSGPTLTNVIPGQVFLFWNSQIITSQHDFSLCHHSGSWQFLKNILPWSNSIFNCQTFVKQAGFCHLGAWLPVVARFASNLLLLPFPPLVGLMPSFSYATVWGSTLPTRRPCTPLNHTLFKVQSTSSTVHPREPIHSYPPPSFWETLLWYLLLSMVLHCCCSRSSYCISHAFVFFARRSQLFLNNASVSLAIPSLTVEDLYHNDRFLLHYTRC